VSKSKSRQQDTPNSTRLIPVASTILDSAKESVFPEEQEQVILTSLYEALDTLIQHAYLRRDFAKKLCEDVSRFSQVDRELVAIVKKSAKSSPGRYPKESSGEQKQLLMEYASLMKTLEFDEYKNTDNRAIGFLSKMHAKRTGREISAEAMQNKISKAIREIGSKLDVPWAIEVIKERVERGKKWNK